MSINLGDILSKLGWDDGFQIPIANDENKALEKELAELSLRKNKARNTLDTVNVRLEGLREHFKFVGQENDQTQKLITAHRQQLEATENDYHNTKSERDNTRNGIRKLEKQANECQERLSLKKNDLQKSVAKADQLKADMDWDAEALKAWEESLKKRDEDSELIKKFSKEDERRYNELEAKRQHLQDEYAAKKKVVARIAAEANNYELVLERLGKVIKQQVAERETLINQWKETVRMLQQRDQDIAAAQEQVGNVYEMIETQKEKLEDEGNFLKNQQRTNHEIELEVQNLNSLHSRMRRDLGELNQHELLLISELQTLKRQVSTSEQFLENQRIQKRHLSKMLHEKEFSCGQTKEEIEKLRHKLNEIHSTHLSSSERISRVEKLIDTEERLYKIFLSDTEKINTLLFRSERYLKEQKAAGKNLELDINNALFTCNQLEKHIRVGKKELEKIREVVYNMEFRIDEVETKLQNLRDEKHNEDQNTEIEKRIHELEQTLVDHKDVQHALQHQVDALQDDMRKLSNLIAYDREQMNGLKDKCENNSLLYEIGKKHIAAAKQSTQEKQVEENVMRLRLAQIEKERRKEEKQIFNMEVLRLHLDQAMKERQLEINTKKAIIQAKYRNLEDDKSRLKADIALRRLKIEQIQKKYYIALTSLGKNEDGDPISVTQLKIKNAQEKFMLQQEGDEFDQRIKNAEKEIIAMENTLKLVNVTNASFKNSLAPVRDDGEEVTQLKHLEDQLEQTNSKLKKYKNEISQKDVDKEQLLTVLNEAQENLKGSHDVVSSLEQEIDLIRKQEMEKSKMLQRADCALKRVVKKINKKNVYKYDRDYEIRQLQDANNQVLQRLFEMSNDYPDMCPLIKRYATEYQVVLPTKRKTPSTQSSYSTLSPCTSSQPVSNSSFESSLNNLNLILEL